ncbi:MAG: GAF domain-containing protein, partial [Actinobacteria bacterium]|nr:GAF domain-containing protein [Actinomycetota bacterium]
MATQVDLGWMGVGLVISGLVFYLVVRFSARKAEQALGETMRAASAIVSGGLASDDPESGPDAMLAELARLLDADASVIAIPTGDGRLERGASFGYSEPDRQFIEIEEGLSGRAFTTGSPVIAPDVSKEPSYEPTVEGIRSAVAVPLRVGGRIIGALNVESSHRRYTERDLAVLGPLADQIAALLENQRLTRAEEDRRASEGRARDEID